MSKIEILEEKIRELEKKLKEYQQRLENLEKAFCLYKKYSFDFSSPFNFCDESNGRLT